MKALLILFLLGCSAGSFAQQDSQQPPYKRFPSLPGLQLFLSDSTKYTNEQLPGKKPVLLVLFSPDCDHCQHEAEQIVARQEDLQHIHIIMVTTSPISRMTEFAKTYGLDKMQNVVMAKDPYYVLLSFYAVRNFPYLALYNKKGKLVQTFEGSTSIDKVLKALNTAR